MAIKRCKTFAVLLAMLLCLCLTAPLGVSYAETGDGKQRIIDGAGLLSAEQVQELNELAAVYSAERETDMMVVTSRNEAGTDVLELVQNYYDQNAPGYDKPHGNAAILMVDMNSREIYLAGFYKGETYLDNSRLDKIRNRITPYLTEGDYEYAFLLFLSEAHRYMGYEPGFNPDNWLHHLWFQVLLSVVIGAGIVGVMAYHSGGRITVNRATYEDSDASGVVQRTDQYIRTTVTRRKIEKNNGGGGGGVTGGGHSHSGSRGSF